MDREVLRTVYLPYKIDEIIRVVALRENMTKNDLIQEALIARNITDIDEYINMKNGIV